MTNHLTRAQRLNKRYDEIWERATTLKACEELSVIANRMQREICANINRDVPASVVGMPYARQYVLETLAKLLQACV